MTSLIGTLVMNMIEMVLPAEAEPQATECPRPRAVEQLLWRVARGDRSALAALYDQTCALAYGLALRITGDRAAAEEVSVAVYQEAWQSAPAIAGNTCFLSWLAESTRSRALEQRRPVPRYHSSPSMVAAKASAPSEKGQAAPLPRQWEARRRRALAALEALAPEVREVVELAYFSGLKVSDVAQQLELPEERVKALLRSGMMTFRCAVNQQLPSRTQ